MKRYLVVIISIMLVAAMIAGCGGSDDAASTGKPSASASTDASAKRGQGDDEIPESSANQFIGYWYAEDDADQCMAIYEDGTFEMLDYGEVETEGKYKADGTKATFTAENENIEGSIKGGNLVLVNPDDSTDTITLKRGDAPAPPEDDDDADISGIVDTFYANGDMDAVSFTLNSDYTFETYDEEGGFDTGGTFEWDGEYLVLTSDEGDTITLLLTDEDTFTEEGGAMEFKRESASASGGGDENEDWIELEFINNTGWTFTEIYVYEFGADDEGYNHIANIGELADGESCGIGIAPFESYSISLTDEDGDIWYYTLIEMIDGCVLDFSNPDSEPLVDIYFPDGEVVNDTGSIL